MLPKVKVLIADGNEIVRIYLKDIFWINGFEDRCELLVADNLDAVDAIIADPTTRPDAIFLGLSLPKKIEGGRTAIDPQYSFALTRRIKDDPELQHIRVFIFSSHIDKRFERDAKNAKADKYIYKDQTLPRDLIDVIRGITDSQEQVPSFANGINH